MSFAESSQNFRLVGTILHAQCRDEHGNFHNSTLDVNHILGNHEGQFDRNGSHFHETSSICGLNHTLLVASLRRSDGSYKDALINLNDVVRNNNGRLEKAW
ncbi:Cyanovirin-N [Mycena maculata]|uniref:Cyanovirin-N n=1 Tax=Mycena maculata TaxID=230809 RepID=A0AAD7K729_9AGAR|nr:Cyanovirin-N [Mycena maculata]